MILRSALTAVISAILGVGLMRLLGGPAPIPVDLAVGSFLAVTVFLALMLTAR